MSILNVTNLTFAYEGSYDNVFENASFQLDTNWKLGLIGRNGRGKTTLLQILMNRLKAGGSIESSVQFDYFPYPVSDPEAFTETVLSEVCPDAAGWQILRELSLLQVDEDVLYRPFGTLSNGEQTKVLLAALFLNEGHFLLIDEPTNHLDTAARGAVAQYLNRKQGFLLVSHDRQFLDACIDHVLYINRSKIGLQRGNFSSWWENQQRQEAFEEGQNQRLKKDIRRLQQASRQTANWSDKVEKTKQGTRNSGLRPDTGYIGHKAAKMMKRSKTIEARTQQALEDKQGLLLDKEECESLKIHPLRYHSSTLIQLQDVAIAYGDKQVCSGIDFTVEQGERIFLSGQNGSGKSSLLKLLLGEDVPYSGQCRVASGLVISYVPQTAADLRGGLSQYATECDIDETLFKAILRKMDFERVQFEKDMEQFSAGQKKKVLLARSLCQPAHLYIWDEPLNYIDVYSRMQIEQLLLHFQPTMLLVEHDAAFQAAVGTRSIQL